MKVYAIAGRISSYVSRMARTGEERPLMNIVIAAEKRFRYADLIAYGLNEGKIQRMVDDGFLKEIRVGRRTALSIAGYHKVRTDKNYRSVLLNSLATGRARVDHKARMAAVADALRQKYRARRRALLKTVIMPEFSVCGKLPEQGVSIKDVEEALERYPMLLAKYPTDVYAAVMYDMKRLGIKTSAASIRNEKTWKKKLENDPELRAMLVRRAQNATAERIRIYAREPERAEACYRASAATRHMKMMTDPDFRQGVLDSLDMARDVLWEKCRTDKKFRKKIGRTHSPTLARGLRTIKRRAALRRLELKTVLEGKFGNIYDHSMREMSEYLASEMPGFLERYYSGSPSAIKKDVVKLRAIGA